MSQTRGGENKRKAFEWEFNLSEASVTITNENGIKHEFSVTEIQAILTRLSDAFGMGWFPLANNVEHMGDGSEQMGLGMTILKGSPGDVSHAQGASYLGAVLEEIGYFEWNGKSRGIMWRLLSADFAAETLAAKLKASVRA